MVGDPDPCVHKKGTPMCGVNVFVFVSRHVNMEKNIMGSLFSTLLQWAQPNAETKTELPTGQNWLLQGVRWDRFETSTDCAQHGSLDAWGLTWGPTSVQFFLRWWTQDSEAVSWSVGNPMSRVEKEKVCGLRQVALVLQSDCYLSGLFSILHL